MTSVLIQLVCAGFSGAIAFHTGSPAAAFVAGWCAAFLFVQTAQTVLDRW